MKRTHVYEAVALDIERVIEGLRSARNDALKEVNRQLDLADGLQAQIDRLWRQHAGIVDLETERRRRAA